MFQIRLEICYYVAMTSADRITIKLIDSSLFLRKVTVVFIATAILVPLVYYKLYVPAGLYVTSLLVLHLVFLHTYFSKVRWTRLMHNRVGFGTRILAILLFIYLLAVLRFHGSFVFVMANLAAGLLIHTLILASLMAEIGLAVDK